MPEDGAAECSVGSFGMSHRKKARNGLYMRQPRLALWSATMDMSFDWVIPILRIFDIAKADEFYQGYLGFKVDWDHRFDENAPLYRQMSRGNLILHLSEHHGDGSPGARLRVMMKGVREFHAEISAKGYRYMRPGLEPTLWGTLETGVIDPFGTIIRFCERIERPSQARSGSAAG
jgi:uncharacterized glyoxalase superfamily protein PhnB